jgi:magnesium transporter
MADRESLTLAFVTAHPAEAARILERLNVTDAAALFDRLPARSGAPVLTAMLPSAAARILTFVSPLTASSLLASCGTQAMVAILRQIAEPKRSQLVKSLPTTSAVASRLLLHYANDSVGAWIDPDIFVLPPDATVAEAIARVASGKEHDVEMVFSVDHEQRLVGAISVAALLRASGVARLSSIVRKPHTVLTASATISGMARRRGWRQSAVTPVIDRNSRLIGVLRRDALDRAMATGHRLTRHDDTERVATIMAQGYWNAFAALTQASVSLLPKAKPIVDTKS